MALYRASWPTPALEVRGYRTQERTWTPYKRVRERERQQEGERGREREINHSEF